MNEDGRGGVAQSTVFRWPWFTSKLRLNVPPERVAVECVKRCRLQPRQGRNRIAHGDAVGKVNE